jgi:acyl carrier protein
MLEEIKKIINDILINDSRPKLESIDKKMSLRGDIGLDSLDLAQLTVQIEEKYSVDIFEDGFVERVEDVIKKID